MKGNVPFRLIAEVIEQERDCIGYAFSARGKIMCTNSYFFLHIAIHSSDWP
jgi:hypothetical protein